MPAALIAVLAIAALAALLVVVVLVNRAISHTSAQILIHLSKGIGSYTVTQLAKATDARGFLIAPALQFLQWQGMVESKQSPGRLRGTGAAALDRATYRITDKGRQRIRREITRQRGEA